MWKQAIGRGKSRKGSLRCRSSLWQRRGGLTILHLADTRFDIIHGQVADLVANVGHIHGARGPELCKGQGGAKKVNQEERAEERAEGEVEGEGEFQLAFNNSPFRDPIRKVTCSP